MSRPSSRRDNGQSGFTMVEVLVALAVTAIGLTGVLIMQASSARSNRIARETTAATAICERTMEQLREMSIDDIVATLGEGELPFEIELLDVEGDGGVTYARLLRAEPVEGSPGLVKLRVDVDWTEAGRGEPGDESGRFDHAISLEVVRTRLETL